MAAKKKKNITTFFVVIGVLIIGLLLCCLGMFRYLSNALSVRMTLPGGYDSVMGKNLSLPDKYSQLVPLYPKSRITSVIDGEHDVIVSLKAADEVMQINEWYEAEIKKAGYVIDDATTMNEVSTTWFHNDEYKGNLTVSNKDYAHPGETVDEARINFSLEKK